MKQLKKYNNILYIVLRILIAIDIMLRTTNTLYTILFFSLFTVIVINDHIKWKYLYKDVRWFYTSTFISIVLSLILATNVGGYIDIYFYIILYELILYTEGSTSKKLVILLVGIILTLPFTRIFKLGDISSIEYLKDNLLEHWKENLLDIMMFLMPVLFYTLILFTYKALGKEKTKVDKLNKELELSYNMLEELTITKERNRVAGEIHDNLGHGLIALNMNLDVAEKIIDKDVKKAKELIQKSQELTKENMENLRKAVYALKEERPRGFKDSIKEIIKNIEASGSVLVSVNVSDEAEELLPEYKEIIYSTIKEALTNSIKHGRADRINIDMNIEEEVKVSISDNGIGCEDLVKGNGLLGIEARVQDYNGEVSFSYNENGFKIDLILPK